ncbi:MAG: type II toxin-antitoxin system HicB family antitoxin [Desulfurispora sp.]|uniref:type II toxin-antitoxin system HicB family antitoxin n=1 Tax=Desulfurispora sp. TaxID=3014275 RepID=UPI00404B58CB
MQRRFKVVLEWNNEGGGYTVTVPALPGCITEGDTLEEALANAREAITGYIRIMEKLGQPVPLSDLPPVQRQELVINI